MIKVAFKFSFTYPNDQGVCENSVPCLAVLTNESIAPGKLTVEKLGRAIDFTKFSKWSTV